jgi:hypothetical protein
VGRDAPDRRQPTLHDGVRGAAHRADPPPRRAVPAQGASHPHRAQGARPRLAAVRTLHQARHPQGRQSASLPHPPPTLEIPGLIWAAVTGSIGRPVPSLLLL